MVELDRQCPAAPGVGGGERARPDREWARQARIAGRGPAREAQDEEHDDAAHDRVLACLVAAIQAYSPAEGTTMVEKTIELTGTSTNSIEDAVGLAVARAAATIKGIKPEVEVDRITCVVEDGGVTAWRVRVKVSFAVQEQIHE
jgi:flavin-binding protein dodecin